MRHDNRIRARLALALAVALSLVSMALYPGGTALSPSTVHYSPWRNFLSDLGMTVAYDGRPNPAGAACFVAAVLLLIGGALAVLAELLRLFARSPRGRTLARIAAVVALCSALCFAGVAFTPENLRMAAHVDFTFWGFRIAPVATLMLTLAAASTDSVPRTVVRLLVLLTATLAAYDAVLEWGPDAAHPAGLHVQVVAQKLVVGIAIVSLLGSSVAIPRGATPADAHVGPGRRNVDQRG